ncbi:hypothetical protein [Streptomyces sp. SJL17-1]|uniref:hypothetical protein n=1 Tax=Streptomyces sp. SJL17-1 TaxID=2967223 RepID=UPI00398FF653
MIRTRLPRRGIGVVIPQPADQPANRRRRRHRSSRAPPLSGVWLYRGTGDWRKPFQDRQATAELTAPTSAALPAT